jgi:hypothetical protein
VDRVDKVELRVDIPHSARVYDYILGGKDNYPADREIGDRMIEAVPRIRETARANRRFMVRATRYLTAEAGIRQFLDIGTGLPTSPNLHEIAQNIDPTTRVVYVDNDPIVLVNARALLTGTKEGLTSYLNANLHQPQAIMESSELRRALDLDRPIAVSLIAILHFVVDDDEARRIIQHLTAPLVPGSALAITTLTLDGAPEMAGIIEAGATGGIPSRFRSRAEVEALLTGFDLVDPGLTFVNEWRPDPPDVSLGEHAPVYGAVAFKR